MGSAICAAPPVFTHLQLMCIPKYDHGTVEYYKSHFSDILADAGDDDDKHARGNIILTAFIEALKEWMGWHENAAKIYNHMLDRLLYLRDF